MFSGASFSHSIVQSIRSKCLRQLNKADNMYRAVGFRNLQEWNTKLMFVLICEYQRDGRGIVPDRPMHTRPSETFLNAKHADIRSVKVKLLGTQRSISFFPR